MNDSTLVCVSASGLTVGAINKFYDVFFKKTLKTIISSDENAYFSGSGIGLLRGGELVGLYTYKSLASLVPNVNFYYPQGGMLGEYQYTSFHDHFVIELLKQIGTDSKAQIIIRLDQQPVQRETEVCNAETFWLAHGFSPLDVQVSYQGTIKHIDIPERTDFCVSTYTGGDERINSELCQLHRNAYAGKLGVPDMTSAQINQTFAMPGYSYLLVYHDDTIIGQAAFLIKDTDCYVDSLFIKRKYWASGASDRLTQAMFMFAQNKGCETVSGVAASNNRASRGLMERFGLLPQHQIRRMSIKL